MIIGGMIGLVVAIVLSKAMETEASWMEYVEYVVVLAGIVLGTGSVRRWTGVKRITQSSSCSEVRL